MLDILRSAETTQNEIARLNIIWRGEAQRERSSEISRMKEVEYDPSQYRVDVLTLVIHGNEHISETYR